MPVYRTPINIEQKSPGKGQPTTQQGEAPLSHEYFDYSNFGFQDSDEFSDLRLAEELKHFDGLRKLYAYLDYNAAIGAYRQMTSDLSQTVEWSVKPAKPIDALEDDDDIEPTPAAVNAAVFVKKALRSLTTDRPWKRIVAEAMTSPVYGCAIFEMSYRKQGNEWYWDDFGFRDRKSIVSILTDSKRRTFNGLKQQHRNGTWGYMSPSRLLIICHQPEFGVLGRSVFETAYGALRRQNELETLSINVLRRALGTPTLLRPARIGATANQSPPDIFNNPDTNTKRVIKSTMELLMKCHRGERIGGIIPSWLEEALATKGSATGKDLMGALNRLDHAVLDPVSASFLLLAQGSIGSRSLAETLVRIFLLRVNGLIQYIGDEVSRVAVPQLLRLNRMNTEDAPRIVPTEVSVALTQVEADRTGEEDQTGRGEDSDT